MKHVIIGNGIAGVKAAETIRRNDASAEIVIISTETEPFYLKPMMPDYVAGKAEEAALLGRRNDFYKSSRIETIFGRTVSGIDTKGRAIVLDGAPVRYDTLLIASGADIAPAIDLLAQREGVYTFRRLADARAIRAAAEKAKAAIVVGDGIMGLELARALRARDINVIFLSENERLWPDVLDEAASKLLADIIVSHGVDIRFKTRITDIERQGGKFVGVKTNTGDLVRGDFLGLGGRFAPNVSFLKGSGIHCRQGVLVGRFLNTNVPEVFAAGDVARPTIGPQDRPDVNIRWHTAWQQGAVAGLNMLGGRVNYAGVLSTTSTQVFGVDLMSVGTANPREAGYVFETGDYPAEGVGVYKKLVFKDDVLVGALLVGSVSEGKKIENEVLAGRRRAEMDGSLMRAMFDLSQPLAPEIGAVCPVCKLEIPLDKAAHEGQRIACPACGVEFRLTRVEGRWRLAR